MTITASRYTTPLATMILRRVIETEHARLGVGATTKIAQIRLGQEDNNLMVGGCVPGLKMFRHLISTQWHVILKKGRRDHLMQTWQQIFRGHDEELYDKILELYPERVKRYPSGFRRTRPSRKFFRTKGVYLCGSCNS